jgi:hypothetical protein
VAGAQLDELNEEHKATGKPLADVVVDLGIVEKDELLRRIAAHLGYDFVAELPSQFPGEAIAALTGKLARSLFLTDNPQEALETLDALPEVHAQSDRDRLNLLRGRILEELGRNDEALPILADVSERLPGDEARCRYAALLLKMGKKGKAQLVLEDVEHRLKRVNRQRSAADAPMYDWAMSELARLRG